MHKNSDATTVDGVTLQPAHGSVCCANLTGKIASYRLSFLTRKPKPDGKEEVAEETDMEEDNVNGMEQTQVFVCVCVVINIVVIRSSNGGQ